MGSTAAKFTLYAVLILVLFAHELPAAEEADKTTRLEELTVVATPIIQGNEVDRYASQKTVVTESQIEDLNA
jgi:iron complex outermembrane receptor protein